MKRFFARLGLFLALLAVGCCATLMLSSLAPFRAFFAELTDSTDYSHASSDEILPYIDLVKTPDSTTKLLIGDSVCWQLCDPLKGCNEVYRIAGTNRAITLAGQYLMADAYLESHPAATDVYLMLGPEAFSSGYDATFGYQYGVIPFVRAGLLPRLDDTTRAELEAAYGSLFLEPKIVGLLDYSPLAKKLYLNLLTALPPDNIAGAVNALSVRYLTLLDQLCEEKGVALHLFCTPLADTADRRTVIEGLKAGFASTGLSDRFPDFFDHLLYYPAEEFKDGIHFKDEFADMSHLTEILNRIQSEVGQLEGFVTMYPPAQ